jgi:predicted HTH domain antitoxin
MYCNHSIVYGDSVTEVISTRIPDKLAKDLKEIEKEEESDRATTIRKLLTKAIKEWKIEHALELYHEGKVTLWRAARLAEVSLREIMERAAKKGIEFKYTEKDLEEDIQAALKE